ncbi:hypothetical protein SUGI_0442840 [Cryptomeria japonica]|nr:hypothetical protein SUGI_0442840 [Cryptomeria japonica]
MHGGNKFLGFCDAFAIPGILLLIAKEWSNGNLEDFLIINDGELNVKSEKIRLNRRDDIEYAWNDTGILDARIGHKETLHSLS